MTLKLMITACYMVDGRGIEPPTPCRVKALIRTLYKRLYCDFLEQIRHYRALLSTIGTYEDVKSDAKMTPRMPGKCKDTRTPVSWNCSRTHPNSM